MFTVIALLMGISFGPNFSVTPYTHDLRTNEHSDARKCPELPSTVISVEDGMAVPPTACDTKTLLEVRKTVKRQTVTTYFFVCPHAYPDKSQIEWLQCVK